MLKSKEFLNIKARENGPIYLSFTKISNSDAYYVVVTSKNNQYYALIARLSNVQYNAILTDSIKELEISKNILGLPDNQMILDKMLMLLSKKKEKELSYR